ncbi:MAG: hypothetical protein IKT46_00315 [Clostridia bacterium]|nr:hypothetical protein [Clostridia bacterium]
MYTQKYNTLNHDADINGILRPTAIQRYMQETANRQLRDFGPSYEELWQSGKAFILSRMAVNIYRPIKQYEDIEVATWPCDSDKGVAFNRSYAIYIDGEEVARGVGVWALVDIETKKLLRVEEADLSNLEAGPVHSVEGLRFRMPREGMSEAGQHRVTYNLVDCNMHMNNTNYPDMFYSFIPGVEKYYVKDMSFTYRAEAPLGAELTVHRSDAAANEDGSLTYYFRSYVGDTVNCEAMITVCPVN